MVVVGFLAGYFFAVSRLKDEKFDPGSLFKVPIMMAYYKEAEIDPRVLEKKYITISFLYQNFYPKNLNQISNQT